MSQSAQMRSIERPTKVGLKSKMIGMNQNTDGSMLPTQAMNSMLPSANLTGVKSAWESNDMGYAKSAADRSERNPYSRKIYQHQKLKSQSSQDDLKEKVQHDLASQNQKSGKRPP